MEEEEGQRLYLLFVKQPSPFEPDEIIDPLVGIVTDRGECLRFEAEHKDLEVSLEYRFVEDAEGHHNENGDTVYAFFDAACIRDSPEGDILDLLTDAAVKDVMYHESNARKLLDGGDMQVMTVGDIRLKGDFTIVKGPPKPWAK